MKNTFLGTAAPQDADVVLFLEVGMGLALLVGAVLARMGKFRYHAWCQSTVVLLNAVVIGVAMVPSFHSNAIPGIPARLGKSYYAIATAHAALGTVTECAALYILLAAGTNLLPKRLRLRRYKLWMRVVLASWWMVLVFGLVTYARWYVPHWSKKSGNIPRSHSVLLLNTHEQETTLATSHKTQFKSRRN